MSECQKCKGRGAIWWPCEENDFEEGMFVTCDACGGNGNQGGRPLTTSKGELSALLRALADGIDRFSPDWGLENNQEWEVLSAEKKRAREIADEIDNVLTRGDGALITPYDATVENIRESLKRLAARLRDLEQQNARLQRVQRVAATIFDIAAHSFGPTKPCPHGNGPPFPTYGWWCNDCFLELQDALEALEEANNE